MTATASRPVTAVKEDFNTAAKPQADGLQKAIFQKLSLEDIKKLLASGANIEERNGAGLTPLMRALLLNRLDVMRLLIERKADLNARDDAGKTALMLVYQCSNGAEMARLLVDSGADIDMKDPKGFTAIDYAHKYKRDELVDILQGVIDARNSAATAKEVQAWHTMAEENQRQVRELYLKRKKAGIRQKAGV